MRHVLGIAYHHGMRLPALLHRAARKALEHDCLNLAQSAAYSAIAGSIAFTLSVMS